MELSIPLLGTNVDYDIKNWTMRLFGGIDYPVLHKVVAAGGCEGQLMSQLKSVRNLHPDVTLLRGKDTMGTWVRSFIS